MPPYQDKYTETFQSCISQYPNLKKRQKNAIRLIVEKPYYRSHLLTKIRNIDLRGRRSRHFGSFIVIFVICEECKKNNFEEIIGCPKCLNDSTIIIFIAFGPHDDIYRREWIISHTEI